MNAGCLRSAAGKRGPSGDPEPRPSQAEAPSTLSSAAGILCRSRWASLTRVAGEAWIEQTGRTGRMGPHRGD